MKQVILPIILTLIALAACTPAPTANATTHPADAVIVAASPTSPEDTPGIPSTDEPTTTSAPPSLPTSCLDKDVLQGAGENFKEEVEDYEEEGILMDIKESYQAKLADNPDVDFWAVVIEELGKYPGNRPGIQLLQMRGNDPKLRLEFESLVIGYAAVSIEGYEGYGVSDRGICLILVVENPMYIEGGDESIEVIYPHFVGVTKDGKFHRIVSIKDVETGEWYWDITPDFLYRLQGRVVTDFIHFTYNEKAWETNPAWVDELWSSDPNYAVVAPFIKQSYLMETTEDLFNWNPTRRYEYMIPLLVKLADPNTNVGLLGMSLHILP